MRASSVIRALAAWVAILFLASSPILADGPEWMDYTAPPNATPEPGPSGTPDCTDAEVGKMLGEAGVFHRRLDDMPSPAASNAVFDRLWNRAAGCSTPIKRGALSHHAFKQYMSAITMETADGAVVKARVRKYQGARFYITSYRALEKDISQEAKDESWTFWLAFTAKADPVIHKLDKSLRKAGF